MIERIKFIQETKIDELLTLIKDEGEKEYTVKAPTGSGKTYMQGYLINKLLEKYPNSKIIYQTLSKAGLPIQAFNSITDKFKNNFKNINAILLSTNHSNEERISISENYNTYFLPKQLNIKGGNLENPLKDFLIYKTKNCQKFLIIDECHEKATNIMKYENEFDYVFNFSATPKKEQTKPGRFVELEEEVCEKYNLIKTKVIDDKEVDILKTDGTLDTNKLKNRIQKSISKFVSIQNDYKGTNINPAMVIQISNDFKGLDELKIILEELNKKDLL
jgi:type III restriction enzyme